MKLFVKASGLVALLLACTFAFGGELNDFEAEYLIKRNGKRLGVAHLTLTTTPEGQVQYELVSKGDRGLAKLLGFKFTESSTAQLSDGELRPISYEYRQKARFRSRKREAHFDWEAMRADGINRKDRWSLAVPQGVYDRRLVELALALDVNAGKQNVQYDVVSKGRLKQYSFQVVGTEPIDVPLGRFETKVVNRVKQNSDKQIKAYYAASLPLAPARIVYIDEDETLELSVVSYQSEQGASTGLMARD